MGCQNLDEEERKPGVARLLSKVKALPDADGQAMHPSRGVCLQCIRLALSSPVAVLLLWMNIWKRVDCCRSTIRGEMSSEQ